MTTWTDETYNSNTWVSSLDSLYVLPYYWQAGYCDDDNEWNEVIPSTNTWIEG
jgi:hypothetical protein